VTHCSMITVGAYW